MNQFTREEKEITLKDPLTYTESILSSMTIRVLVMEMCLTSMCMIETF